MFKQICDFVTGLFPSSEQDEEVARLIEDLGDIGDILIELDVRTNRDPTTEDIEFFDDAAMLDYFDELERNGLSLEIPDEPVPIWDDEEYVFEAAIDDAIVFWNEEISEHWNHPDRLRYNPKEGF